jgi:hypothetical protein
MRLMLFLLVRIAAMCHYVSPTTIFSPLSKVMISELRTLDTCLFPQATICHDYGRHLRRPKVDQNVRLLQRKRFPIDSRRLDQPLIISD